MASLGGFLGLDYLQAPTGGLEWGILAFVAVATFVFAIRTASLGDALAISVASFLSYFVVGNVSVAIALAAVAAFMAVWRHRFPETDTPTRSPIIIEIGIVAIGLAIYEVGRLNTVGAEDLAIANAEQIVALERSMGLLFEARLQSMLLVNGSVTQVFNSIYTYSFLAAVFGGLYWLGLVDRANFRLLRDSLFVSAALAVVAIASYPVAPPRLMPDLGILDSVIVMGREHGFANEFAAVPSLHVGWMVLVGYVVGRSIGGRRGFAIGAVPGVVMSVTVIVTGNHYWIDGVIGAAFAMALPAAYLMQNHMASVVKKLSLATRHTTEALAHSRSAQFTTLTLFALLTYLIAGQIIAPGFTAFWGYLVMQMAVTLVLLLGGEVIFAKQGGLSWQTHVIAVGCGYLDVLGTDGNLYARIDEYDKLTHFAGVAAVTSGVYDCFSAMNIRRGGTWPASDRWVAAVSIGVAAGVGWEVYELIGDKVFNTSRIGGAWDTTNDLVMDTLGALGAGSLLWWLETTGRERRAAKAPSEGAWHEASGPGGAGGSGS